VKDNTIAALLERDRETNILVGQLQKMLTRCSGAPTRRNLTRTRRGPLFANTGHFIEQAGTSEMGPTAEVSMQEQGRSFADYRNAHPNEPPGQHTID
jgi:hypothetical protein